MILLNKPENQYPTHFWISAKSLENGCFLDAILSISHKIIVIKREK